MHMHKSTSSGFILPAVAKAFVGLHKLRGEHKVLKRQSWHKAAVMEQDSVRIKAANSSFVRWWLFFVFFLPP